jgi:hypothetical protein
MRLFRTRHQGVAAVLRYSLGPDAHLKTYREQRGVTFLFDDTAGACSEITRQFFDDHDEGPFGVSDARALIESFVEVRRTMTAAIQSSNGQWSSGEGDIEG